MLPEGTIRKWHNVKKAIQSAGILKKISHTIYLPEKINEFVEFCDENAQIFLAKLCFQDLLTAKLSFLLLNVPHGFASSPRVKCGNTMVPAVAKL